MGHVDGRAVVAQHADGLIERHKRTTADSLRTIDPAMAARHDAEALARVDGA
jgi:hypothetical protein